MALPALAAAIPALSMGVGGAQTLIGALGMLGNKRPDYEIPETVRQSLALAEMKFADPEIAGYDQAKANLDISAANAVQGAIQSGTGSEALGGIVGQQEQGYRQLAAMGAQQQEADFAGLQQSLNNFAAYEDMEYQMNEFAPYAQKFQLFSDMIGGGLENTMQGMDKALLIAGRGASMPGMVQTNAPLQPLPTTPLPTQLTSQQPYDNETYNPDQLNEFLRMLMSVVMP